MAGSSVSASRASQDIGRELKKYVQVTLAYVSDDTDGHVPDQVLSGLDDYKLISVQPIPDAVAPATSAFEVRVEDANGAAVFLSGSIAVDSKTPVLGLIEIDMFPHMGASATLKLVGPADHVSAADIGNEKELILILLLEKI